MASGSLRYRIRHGVLPHEIEPGRGVPANWDKALVETWAQRKARLARQRAGASIPADAAGAGVSRQARAVATLSQPRHPAG
ncbi:MAG: hypothetical protein P4L73_20655 [Caulobacteraceae bacterium]|nr:hypothetical protein [Caulobacteraceae bacterium]